MQAAHNFQTTRSPTAKDREACAVLAQALVDGSEEAEEALEVQYAVACTCLFAVECCRPPRNCGGHLEGFCLVPKDSCVVLYIC